jgi:toxin FitB
MHWIHEVDEDRVFLSVVTIAELRRGVALMSPGARRTSLDRWFREDLPARFEGRLLPIDRPIAERWGDLMAYARQHGFGLSLMDGFLAATAQVRSLTLVTRNVRDFSALGLPLSNPWDA